MPILSRTRRPRRPGEWTEARAVTFIVTLAATQNVTLAARRAGISRKSAYALKSRDAAFARAWTSALAARSAKAAEGDKVREVCDPRLQTPGGDSRSPLKNIESDTLLRDSFFAGLAATRGDSAAPVRLRRSLARPRPLA